jgi:hypothetical protein
MTTLMTCSTFLLRLEADAHCVVPAETAGQEHVAGVLGERDLCAVERHPLPVDGEVGGFGTPLGERDVGEVDVSELRLWPVTSYTVPIAPPRTVSSEQNVYVVHILR